MKSASQHENSYINGDDGYTFTEVELTGQKSADHTFEGFLANSLNLLGVKEIAGFLTRRYVGTAQMFSPNGDSFGRVTIWGKGFQRKP